MGIVRSEPRPSQAAAVKPLPRAQAKPAAKAKKATTEPKAPPKKRGSRSPVTYFQFDDAKDSLLIAPARYVDCTRFTESIRHIEPEESAMFKLTLTGNFKGIDARKNVVWTVPGQFSSLQEVPKGLFYRSKRMEFLATDPSGNEVVLSAFGASSFQWLGAKKNDALHVTGSYKQFGQKAYFNIEETVPANAINSIWVKYGGVPGQISGDRIGAAVLEAKLLEGSWRQCAGKIIGATGLSEKELLTKIESPFPSLIEMLKALHEPKSMEDGDKASEDARRISALAIQTSALRSVTRPSHAKTPVMVNPADIEELIKSQAEALTEDQSTVVNRISELLSQPKAMSSLLAGDVGTGKTLTYLIPAVAAHLAGAQVSIVAPTSLLADQLAKEAITRFGSKLKGVQRIESGDVIKDPSYLLVGTSGLVGAAKRSKYTPNLAIFDEQHKMGTATREDLLADWTHVLEVSATPIPRSLATALYDGMEILNLRKCPVKKTINSYVVDMASTKKEVVAGIKKAVDKGERCAIVYPLVSTEADDAGTESDTEDVTHTVESAFESFNKAFPGKVVMLHGKMSQDELRLGIEQMRSGEKQIMVASTVIETGIDIPSISMMVVRNADRFGVSQLHQLRGRLVRRGGVGNFLMAVENFEDFPPNETTGEENTTLQRLDAVASTTDGYELAERDLLLRGFGDFTGLNQTGAAKTVFRMVDLKVEDFMARKLRTLKIEPNERPIRNQQAEKSTTQQERLFG